MSYHKVSATKNSKKKSSAKTQTIKKKATAPIVITETSELIPIIDAALSEFINPEFIKKVKYWTNFDKRKQSRTCEDRIEIRLALLRHGQELNEYDANLLISSFALLEKRGEPLNYIIQSATIDSKNYEMWLEKANEPSISQDDKEMYYRIYERAKIQRKEYMSKNKELYDTYKIILKNLKMKDLSYFYEGEN